MVSIPKELNEVQQRIRQAGLPDCNEVGRLFNEYRMFYNQNADIEAARQYIKERMERHDSVILVAETDVESGQGADESNGKSISKGLNCTGFVQLYPSFSSVSMGPIWVLNDLFVHPDYRQKGIARKLLQAAKRLASERGVLRISLSTELNNTQAQALYESEGYARDTKFMYYELNV
ncbi:N-acetyltransferase [Paenibacillus sp. 1781tsa1]|uniref:GNAT family N-acetyltransferase n=1 Tax=Paenibacillus sp. 1781tsa1 TaxID=2953810 RepID=UPI00209E6F94|nr:GNAT family N-acetyltransferase [Paenibacillus sp. 1781tsa1]MCP1183479.1 GNAT family N-acetyltransferase [Paenibacillus sp. 1781tsa1]